MIEPQATPRRPDLSGAVALVTGAGVRIGRALALALGEHGARVAVHYNRSRAEAEGVVARIREAGSDAVALGADLADAGRAGELVDRVVEAFGRLDILVNSASIFRRGPLLETDEPSWDAHLDVNLKAPFFLCQAFARHAAAGDPAEVGARRPLRHIINITDWQVRRPGTSYVAYTVAKAGLEALTLSLARALGPDVRVNAIAPGAILRPPGDESGYFERLARRLPVRRTGSPDDIVRAMLYLLDSDFVTGEVLLVNGGEHL